MPDLKQIRDKDIMYLESKPDWIYFEFEISLIRICIESEMRPIRSQVTTDLTCKRTLHASGPYMQADLTCKQTSYMQAASAYNRADLTGKRTYEIDFQV